MYYEHRFYRPTHPAISDVGPLQIAVIPVEDADYWNEVDAGIIVDEGEVIHFDTLYEDYIDSLLADTYPIQESVEELDPYIDACMMGLGIDPVRRRMSLDEGYEQVQRGYAL